MIVVFIAEILYLGCFDGALECFALLGNNRQQFLTEARQTSVAGAQDELAAGILHEALKRPNQFLPIAFRPSVLDPLHGAYFEDRSHGPFQTFLEELAREIRSSRSLFICRSVSVQPVSIKDGHAKLLDHWFLHEIQPLYGKHQELAQQSLRRKIGALRESVEAALRVQLELSEKGSKKDKQRLRTAETQLRRAAGKFEEVNSFCLKASDTIHDWGEVAISRAAFAVVGKWLSKDGNGEDIRELVNRSLAGTAAAGANQIFDKLQEFGRDLSRALAGAAKALEASNLPSEEELTTVVKEMPRFDPGPLDIVLERDFLTVLGRGLTERRVKKKLKAQIGSAVDEAFQGYGRMLELWIRRTIAELQRRFDSHADAYRAQLERLTTTREAGAEESEAIRRDLSTLSGSRVQELT